MKHRRPEDRDALSPPPAARRLALLALWWERVWPAILPPVGMAGTFLGLALLDVLPMLPGWLHGLTLAGLAGGFGFLAWRGAAALRPPSGAETERRLERDSGVAHRPLEALGDRLADGGGDPAAQALWREHRRRMAELARRLRPSWPSPGMAARDPLGLRAAVLLLLVVGAAAGWNDAPARVGRALSPDIGADGFAEASLEVWVTPPAHTGLAPTLLNAESGTVPMPSGSAVLAVLNGGWGGAELSVDGADTPFKRLPDGTQRIEATIESGRMLAVRQGWRTIAEWPIAVSRDALPSIAFAEAPEAGERGRLLMRWNASDDYGLAKAWVELRRLDAPPSEDPLVVELPLPGGRPPAFDGESRHDLTAHPWSGLPVVAIPVAEDAIGQRGAGEPVTITLPEREFTHPVARAVIEQRRRLTDDPGRSIEAAGVLDAILAHPGDFGGDNLVVLALGLARAALAGGRFDLAEIQDLLWNAALRVEEGDLAAAERSLEEVRRRLEQAIDEGASAAEIQGLMAEFEEALARFLDAMSQRAAESGQILTSPSGTEVLTEEDLARMLDGMRGLAETGSREALREMLRGLAEVLANLQPAPPGAPSGEAAGAMDEIRSIAREQQRLLDQSFRRGQAADGAREGGDARAAARGQEALRRRLEDASEALAGVLGQAPGRLDEAQRSMREAEGELAQGRWGSAAQAQGEALRLMRDGAREAMEQMAAQGIGQGGIGLGGAPRDPLGRRPGGRIIGDDGATRIPEHGEVERAREILDELRRRSGDWRRPGIERDYLRRLLERF